MANTESSIANISYVNKDFQKIFPELLDTVKNLTSKWDPSISNESDPGVILLKLDAILTDKLNYNIDKNVLECFPLSVTQERNARQLYNQLGYRMKWYRGATTNISMKWLGDNSDFYITLPPFTMVTDADNSITYTLVGPDDNSTMLEFMPQAQNLKYDGTTLVFKAIQGTALQYTLNNSTIIKTSDLDSNRRLYFNDYNVAENGIFICNTGTSNYSQWQRKDNLLVESLGNTYYEFGISQDASTCYIEFPEDIDSLIKDGLEIVYIKTEGEDGNISAQVIEKFISDVTLTNSNQESVTLNSDNVKIINYSAATNGANPEGLNEAYRNYKKTIGVFNTLITLRDYISYILRNDLASNGFVSDRGSDPQSSYKIVTSSDGVSQLVDVIDSSVKLINPCNEDGDSIECYNAEGEKINVYTDNPQLSAFDLKLYLLKYNSNLEDTIGYESTFDLMTKSEMTLVEAYLEDTKSINHNFGELLTPTYNRSHICMFINKYPLDIGIVTKSQITEAESIELFGNIRKALFKGLNASSIEFGQQITIELLNDIITASDERIKSVNLGNIDYTTYAIYWDGNNFIKQDISSTNLDNITTQVNYYNVDSSGQLSSYNYNTAASYTQGNYVLYKGNRYRCLKNGTTGVWNPLRWQQDDIKFTFVNETQDLIDGTPKMTAAAVLAKTCGYGNYFTFNAQWTGTSWTFTCDYLPGRVFTLEDLGITSIIDNSISESSPTPACIVVPDTTKSNPAALTIRISLYKQFRDEIYAKSVLAGKTQFYVSDETIDYKWSHANYWSDKVKPVATSSMIQNVSKVQTNSTIILGNKSDGSRKNEIRLRKNETLQLLAPNIVSGTSYSNYVKYEYISYNNINKNEDYQLQANEFIILYWKEDASSYDYYKYKVLGPGTIIKPTFTLTKNSSNVTLLGQELVNYFISNKYSGSMDSNNYPIERVDGLNDKISALTNRNNILTSNKSISERSLLKVQLNSSVPIYWITNNIDLYGNYILEFNNQDERILNAGEYLLYTDNNQTNLNILGPGTKIKIPESGRSPEDPVLSYKVASLDLDQIINLGASYIESESKWITNHPALTLVEYKFIDINPEYYVKIEPKEALTNWYIKFDKDGYEAKNEDDGSDLKLSYCNISYKAADDESYTTIDYVTLDDQNIETWDARSIMSLNISSDTDQPIYEGQSVILTTVVGEKENTEEQIVTISGANLTAIEDSNLISATTRYYLPVSLYSTDSISFDGSNYQNTSYIDSNEDIVYNNIYIFSKLASLDDTSITYTTAGNAVIKLGYGEAQQIGFRFNIPSGKYLIKFENSLSNLFTSKDTLTLKYINSKGESKDIVPIKSNSSNLATMKNGYILLEVDNDSNENEMFILSVPKRPDVFTFTLQNPYKYNRPSSMNQNQFDLIEAIVLDLDQTNIYDFTYRVDDDTQIEDPLNAYSFLNENHIFNQNTICELDSSSSKMKVFGKK